MIRFLACFLINNCICKKFDKEERETINIKNIQLKEILSKFPRLIQRMRAMNSFELSHNYLILKNLTLNF